MKKFLIRVNGTQYDVEVEEVGKPASAATGAPAAAGSGAAGPAPAKKAAPAVADKPAAAGSVSVTAPMPGTIWKVEVPEGQKVTKGQVVIILEAMKMENELVAPKDGTIAQIKVEKGSAVSVGEVLVVIE